MNRSLKMLLPPLAYNGIKKIWKLYFVPTKNPEWGIITTGQNSGLKFYLNKDAGVSQKKMFEGTFDRFMYEYLKDEDLSGKCIFDIGAHFGYHVLCFSKLVGRKGAVYAFEPNKFNIERLEMHIEKNKDISSNVTIFPLAISNSIGKAVFNFSREIDYGSSSGSFIDGAHTPFDLKKYLNLGFEKVVVETTSLDEFIKSDNVRIPEIMKIDVEGAENLIFEGAQYLFTHHKPIILMEIHSIFNMFKAYEFLIKYNYKIKLLKEESDGRCFIGAK